MSCRALRIRVVRLLSQVQVSHLQDRRGPVHGAGHEHEEPADQGGGLHQVQGGQAQPGGLEAAAGLVAHQVQQQDGQHEAEEGAQPQLGLRPQPGVNWFGEGADGGLYMRVERDA